PVGPFATVSFARQRDGHLLVAGYTFDSSSTSSAFVMRLQNPDFRPDPFTFAAVSARPRSTTTTSAALSLQGFNQPTSISVTSGEYNIGCNGTFTAAPGTIAAGQTVCVRHVSSSRAGTRTTTTLDIGGMAGTFTSTTTPEQDLSGEGRADL